MKKPDAKGWICFCDRPGNPDLTYWAKKRRANTGGITGFVDGVKHTYWCEFEVQERTKSTGEKRPIYPSLSRGSGDSFRCAEAQFRLWPNGPRVLASRICAFVWGNKGYRAVGMYTPVLRNFHVFAEYSKIHKDYEAHHLPYRGGKPRPDHAVPGEIVIVLREQHKRIHPGRYKWRKT